MNFDNWRCRCILVAPEVASCFLERMFILFDLGNACCCRSLFQLIPNVIESRG